MTTTGMAVKLELPEFDAEPQVLKGIKRRLADRAVIQGKMRSLEGTVSITAAYGETLTSSEWRERLLAQQLVGAGRFEIGPVACTAHTHELQPPYANVGWHALLTAADTCFDTSIFTLRKGDEYPYSRAQFEELVRGARYAVLRLGEWERMPAAVLERMHAGLTHVSHGKEGKGSVWLANEAKEAADGWACALAAAEVGLHEDMDAATRLELCERAIADLTKLEARGKPEEFALLTARSGRAGALRDAGRLDEALAEVTAAREKAAEHGPIAVSALAYQTATVHAARKEADAAVKALREAIEGNADWRSFARHDDVFALIGHDKSLLKLLADPK
jgi:hypothetical protein